MKGVLTRREEGPPQGFAVRVVEAIRALERHNPQAARWWQENTPNIIKPGQLFVFAEHACELVDWTGSD